MGLTFAKIPDMNPWDTPEAGTWGLTKDHALVRLACLDCTPPCVESLAVSRIPPGANVVTFVCSACRSTHEVTLDGWTVVPLPPPPP